MIEHAYFIKNISDLRLVPNNAGRIYLGSDFCIKAYPKTFSDLIKRTKERYPVSVLIPPVLEMELALMERYINILKELMERDDEIIFNDLGCLFYFINNFKNEYSVGIGRYYSYQKRGVQKFNNVVKKEDLREIPVLDEKMVSFLKSLSVKRVEIDATPYGLEIDSGVDIAISLYLDNILTSYTINCPYTFNGRWWGRKCNRQCLTSMVTFSSEGNVADFFEKGRAYYQDGVETAHPKIDRLVRLEWKNR